jgi:hypothetical protein
MKMNNLKLLFFVSFLTLFGAAQYAEASSACAELVQSIAAPNRRQLQETTRSPYNFGEMITLNLAENNPGQLEDYSKARMATYNLFNLHNFEEGKKKKRPNKKPLHQKLGLAKAIRDMDSPEIIAVQEAGDFQYQQDFLDEFLDGDYLALTMEGNDARGIRVAFWVRKDFPVKIKVHSFREWQALYQSEMIPVFSRDFLVAEVIDPKTDKTLFYSAAVHHKSMRNDKAFPDDPGGRMRREAQVQSSLMIRDMILKRHQTERPPFLVLGDFNADFNKADGNELSVFYKNGFDNSLYVNAEQSQEAFIKHTEVQIAAENRTEVHDTAIPPYSHMGRYKDEGQEKAERKLDLLDSILIFQPDYRRPLITSSHIHHYLDDLGNIKLYRAEFEEEGIGLKIVDQNIPMSYKHRDSDPSDHNPIWADIDIQALLD